MKRGLISVGTNSTRALVAKIDGRPHVLLHRSVGTRIGEGLKERGRLDDAAMERTLEAIREHACAVAELTPDLRVIATSALRRADNAELFARRVRDLTGIDLEILSGEEEAQCSFAGATAMFSGSTMFGVVDCGGGSTEYAVGTHTKAAQIVSCEIGAVRLTEAVPALRGASGCPDDAAMSGARRLAYGALAQIRAFPAVDDLIFVGGTATTVIALLRERREIFEYAQLTRAQLDETLERLRQLDLESRKALPGMNPQRADILLAGLIILDVIFEATNKQQAGVSTNDLLLGYLLRHENGLSERRTQHG